MPYKYAIAVAVYEDGIPPAGNEYKRHTIDYQASSQEVAEGHEKGCYKLVTLDGTEVTDWLRFSPEYRTKEDDSKIRAGKPLKDALGQVLAAGDFVMSAGTYSGLSLRIHEVVSFTPKKVRIREVNGYGIGTPKNPSDIVKVDKSLFF